MSQLMVSRRESDLAFVDELVSISMLETTIVIRPTRRPDALGTQVFSDVVNAAIAAGSTVVLHRLDAVVDSTVAIDLPAGTGVGLDEAVLVEPGGVGLLTVRSESATWSIDFGSDRFVRSDGPVDRLSITGSDWIAFEAMWITPQLVRALTVDGSYVTGRRTLRHPCQQDGRDDLQESVSLSHIA